WVRVCTAGSPASAPTPGRAIATNARMCRGFGAIREEGQFPVSGGVQSARAGGGGQPAGAAPRSPGTRVASELEQVRFLLPLLAAEAIVLWEPTPEARRRLAARILQRSRVRGLPAAGRWQTRPAARARTTERSRKQTERTGCA